MKHLIFYSGGVGSYMTARRVIEKHGKENVDLLFTDTLTEDPDLYRFIVEATAKLFGVVGIADLLKLTERIAAAKMGERKELIIKLAEEASKRFPNMTWIHEGKDIWELFSDVNFIGNSRVAPCTQILKQRSAKRYVKKNYTPEEVTLYLGIDWTEAHRTVAPRKNWSPFQVEYPMIEEPYLSKNEMIETLLIDGIDTPYLYKLGFSHNNCAGLCVKGGQGHWIDVLEKMPDRFEYAENKEQELIVKIQKDREEKGKPVIPVSILTKSKNGEKKAFTLKELREQYERESTSKQLDLFQTIGNDDVLDRFDKGGCGCFGEEEIAF